MAYSKGKSFLDTFGGSYSDICFSVIDILKGDEFEDFGGFYLGSEYAECFLSYFFIKHYDPELSYNKQLFGIWSEVFDWNDNYIFTYEQIRLICDEIKSDLQLLLTDYYNPQLNPVKESFNICSMSSPDDPDYINACNDEAAYKRHLDVVKSFYEGFIDIILRTINDNPSHNLILVSGP